MSDIIREHADDDGTPDPLVVCHAQRDGFDNGEVEIGRGEVCQDELSVVEDGIIVARDYFGKVGCWVEVAEIGASESEEWLDVEEEEAID